MKYAAKRGLDSFSCIHVVRAFGDAVILRLELFFWWLLGWLGWWWWWVGHVRGTPGRIVTGRLLHLRLTWLLRCNLLIVKWGQILRSPAIPCDSLRFQILLGVSFTNRGVDWVPVRLPLSTRTRHAVSIAWMSHECLFVWLRHSDYELLVDFLFCLYVCLDGIYLEDLVMTS